MKITRVKSRVQRASARVRDGLAADRLRKRAEGAGRILLFEADWRGIFYYVRPLVRRTISSPGNLALVVSKQSELSGISKDLFDGFGAPRRNVAVVSYEVLKRSGLDTHCLVSCQPFSQVAAEYSGIPKIQLLHGMADKRGELFGRSKLSDFTHLFSPAPVVTDLARERLLGDTTEGHAHLQVVEIGCPKTDDLFDGTFRRDEVLRPLGLPPDRPTVLYAPTWEKEASLEQYGEQIVTELAQLDVNLLVKPHPLTLADRRDRFLIANGHGGRNWPQILRNLERQFTNMRWVRDAYANPFLVAADLLVTEGSGIALEYILLDKPIIFIDTPLVYIRHGVDNLHYNLRHCGLIIRNLEDLKSSVMNQLLQPTDMTGNRKELIRRLAYNLGQATDIAAAALEHLLDSRP